MFNDVITGRAYAIWATFWEGEGRLYGKQVARWRSAERRIAARERGAAATVAAARGRGTPRPAAEPPFVP